jgi:hypothetical protein
MQQAYIVIFFLFFAVLAFGWFYWQRAKSRDVTPVASSDAAVATSDSPAATPAESTNVAAADAGHDHSDHAGHDHEGHDHSDPDHQH